MNRPSSPGSRRSATRVDSPSCSTAPAQVPARSAGVRPGDAGSWLPAAITCRAIAATAGRRTGSARRTNRRLRAGLLRGSIPETLIEPPVMTLGVLRLVAPIGPVLFTVVGRLQLHDD